MGTHYETLGVTASASTAEIRKAYLRRARALHPDRHLGRPAQEARRAEEAMQQVNVAWNVLSDAKKKAEYDTSLKGRRAPARKPQTRPNPSRPSRQPSAAASRSAASNGSTASKQTAGRAIDEEEGDGSVSIWASIPVLVVIGLLLGIFIVTAFMNDGPSDNRPVIQTDTQLTTGDCFILVGGVPRERACSTGTADGQITGAAPDVGNCPEETQPLPDPNSDFFLCWERMALGTSNTVPSG